MHIYQKGKKEEVRIENFAYIKSNNSWEAIHDVCETLTGQSKKKVTTLTGYMKKIEQNIGEKNKTHSIVSIKKMKLIWRLLPCMHLMK